MLQRRSTRCWSGWQTVMMARNLSDAARISSLITDATRSLQPESVSVVTNGAVTASKEARTISRYGLRGSRVGEATNPGPSQWRRLRRGSQSRLGQSPVDVSSDQEPLVRPNMGRDVLPRVGEGRRSVAVPLTEPHSTVPPTVSPVPNRVEVECPFLRPSRRLVLVLVAEGEHVGASTQPAT